MTASIGRNPLACPKPFQPENRLFFGSRSWLMALAPTGMAWGLWLLCSYPRLAFPGSQFRIGCDASVGPSTELCPDRTDCLAVSNGL